MRITWLAPEVLVTHELVQSADEGRDVADLAARWSAARAAGPAGAAGAAGPAGPAGPGPAAQPGAVRAEAEAEAILAELASRAPADRAAEPAELAAIRALRPAAIAVPPVRLTRAEYADRLHGAWLGRAAGCLLGKPVEKVPREGIRALLKGTGRWPLRAYFTEVGLAPEVAAAHPWNTRSRATSLAEHIVEMPEDDDLNYPLLNLDVLERHGPAFTTDDVAQTWLQALPVLTTFTAERVAYRNLLELREPPETATHRNPYREWIGAQIRGDVFGWTRPGRPEEAAALAWRDARLSHTANGLYGEMFVAALLAAVPACPGDLPGALAVALTQIPAASRYAVAVRRAMDVAATEHDWERVVDVLAAEHGRHHWVHVLNNAALVVAALVHGRGDFVRSICAVVMGGWDTDSNGATVGSVLGLACGARQLPPAWTGPLHNRLRSSVKGFDGIGFDALAARTLAQVPADLLA